MRLRTACLVAVMGAGLGGTSAAQSSDAFRLRQEIEGAQRKEQFIQKREQVQRTMNTPAAPAPVSPSDALQDRLSLLGRQLMMAQNEKAAALKEGKSEDELKALTARIDDLQRRMDAVRAQLGAASAPRTPAKPSAQQ
jgi:hypothetical protein